MPIPQSTSSWLIFDSGVQTGSKNMSIDREALAAMTRGIHQTPVLRFFQWRSPVITYGYLVDPTQVRAWASANGKLPTVQRPTGGGMVVHSPDDVSLSILWPRGSGYFSDRPRACYEEIHSVLKDGVRAYLGESIATLFAKTGEDGRCDTGCEPNDRHLSICFDEPVCNDVMLGGRKIIGGALRITKEAILYQGTVQLKRMMNARKMKQCLQAALEERIRQ